MATAEKPKLLGEGYDWDVSTDYAAVMNDAVARGDYKAAAVAEQQRNAKIRGTGGSEKDMTNNYGYYLDNGASADYGYGYGWTFGNRVNEVTTKDGQKYYTNYANMYTPELLAAGYDPNNIAQVFTFNTPGGVDENYRKHIIKGEEGFVTDYEGLKDREQRALLNERNYTNALLADAGMRYGTTVQQDITGGMPVSNFEQINSLIGNGTNKNTDGRSYGGGFDDNPYADLLEQSRQYYEDNQATINDYIAAMLAAQELQYAGQKENIEEEAEEAQRQAYINRLQNERALPELLAAQGINGGATESATLDMLANYGQHRADINTQKMNALNDVDTALAQLRANAEAERIDRLMSNNESAMNAYTNLYGQMVDYDTAQQQLAMQQAQQEADRQADAASFAISLAEAGLLDGESLYSALQGMGVSKELAEAYVKQIQSGLYGSGGNPAPASVADDPAYVTSLRRLAAESARAGGESTKRAAAEILKAMNEGKIGEATANELTNLLVSHS